MPYAPSRAPSLCRTLGLWTALLGAACTGTPLPEPPDELPRPDLSAFGRDVIAPTSFPPESTIVLAAGAGAVQPGTRVWIINLDSSDPPIEVQADERGGFYADPLSFSEGDRVRILSRTDLLHSPPLDVRVIESDSIAGLPELIAESDGGLSCLRVTPQGSLALRGTGATLTLENSCAEEVELTRAALRLGDQGLALIDAPARLSAGERAQLTVRDGRTPGPPERHDIVLIDAQASDGRTGRYAIDVYSALK